MSKPLIALLCLAGWTGLHSQPAGAIILASGHTVGDFVDSVLQQERSFSIALKRGDKLEVQVEAPFSIRNWFRLYLFSGSPNPYVQLDQVWPKDDGHGGPRLARIERTVAADGMYYLMIYGEDGATSFQITATVTHTQASPQLPPNNCLNGLVQDVRLGANGDMEEAVIGGTHVKSGAPITLPASPQLRAALQPGRSVSACYNESGQIDSITVRSQ